MLAFLLWAFPPLMRGDNGSAFGQARGMILTEAGLHFTKDGQRWRCVEWPALTMLPGDR